MKKVFGIIIMLCLAFFAMADSFNVIQALNTPGAGYAVIGITQTPDRIYAGDSAKISFELQNTKNIDSKNVVMKILAPFTSNATSFSIGNLAPLEKKQVSFYFTVPTSTREGTYPIFVYVIDQTQTQAEVAKISVTVNAQDSGNDLIASIQETTTLFAGDSNEVSILVKNIGTREIEDLIVQIQVNSSSFTPIGSDREYVKSLKAGEDTSIKFRIGVDPLATPGFYLIPVKLNYGIDKTLKPSLTQYLGVQIIARQGLLITSETSGNSVTVTIANSGDAAVRGVYAQASSNAYVFTSAADKFIGTLNLDDSASMSLSIAPKPNAGEDKSIKIKVTYKDVMNTEHTEYHTIRVDNISLNRTASNQFNLIGTNQRYGRQAQNGIFGIDPLWIIIAVLAAVIAFAAYKWRKRKKK